MIKTYFFVPLANPRHIQKVKTLKTDYIIYDLEDAISGSSSDLAYDNLKLIDQNKISFLRPKINWDDLDYQYLDGLVDHGFHDFVIPKASCYGHLKQLVDWSEEKSLKISFILLVENPALLFDLQAILKSFHQHIVGISLGSHDYCSAMKARYDYESYRFPHDFILNLANSFQVEAIDIASKEIDDKENFLNEVRRGFDKGYRSKFILHPGQLEYLEGIELFSQEEIAYARMVARRINLDDFNAIKIDGRILEKPHIQRIKEILKYTGHGTD